MLDTSSIFAVVIVVVSLDILPRMWQSFRMGRGGTLGTARGLPLDFFRLFLSSCLTIICRCGSWRRTFCSQCHSGSRWYLWSLVLQVVVVTVVVVVIVTVVTIVAVVVGHCHWQHVSLLGINNGVALHPSSLTG